MAWQNRTDVDWRVDVASRQQRRDRRLVARFGVTAVGLAALLVACAPLAFTPAGAPAPQVGSRPAQLPAAPPDELQTAAIATQPEPAPTVAAQPAATPVEHSHVTDQV